jgi:signal peptidase I
MDDTLEVGDRLMGEKVSYYFSEPQQGDIITFDDPLENRTLIKRVIAVGGQTIDLRDGKVYIDDKEYVELYVDGKQTYAFSDDYVADGVEISYPYTVPEGYLWVMGDNRTNSSDSRYFGPISVDSVSSKAVVRYWPFDRIGDIYNDEEKAYTKGSSFNDETLAVKE